MKILLQVAKPISIGMVKRVKGNLSEVKLIPKFCIGLDHIADFSHVIIIYWLHLRDNEIDRSTLKVIPKKHQGAPELGVFASRSPSRPNPIGLCVCKLIKSEKCILTLNGLDALEGTPILDIKPYIPRADAIPDARAPEWTLHGPPT